MLGFSGDSNRSDSHPSFLHDGLRRGTQDRSIFVSAKPIILIGNVVLLMSLREKLRDNNLMYFISAYSRVYIYLFIHLFYVKI